MFYTVVIQNSATAGHDVLWIQHYGVGDFADDSAHLGVGRIPHDDDWQPLRREVARRAVHALDERTRRVHHVEAARRGGGAHCWRDPVRGEEHGRAFRDFIDRFDERKAAGAQVRHDYLVVDKLMEAIDGRTQRQRLL